VQIKTLSSQNPVARLDSRYTLTGGGARATGTALLTALFPAPPATANDKAWSATATAMSADLSAMAVGIWNEQYGSQPSQRIVCWYNENNVYTGADSAETSQRLGMSRNAQSGDYAWAYVIEGADGSACPRTRPAG